MEVALTPLEFARRARALYGDREARRRRRAAPHLRAVLRALRPVVGGAAAARREAGRSRRLHRAEHARAARVVLRRAADRRRAGADQLSAQPRRIRLHHHALRRDRRLRARGLPRVPRRRSGRSCRASGTSSRSKASRAHGSGSTTRRWSATRRRTFAQAGDRRARSADHQLHERHDVAAQGRDDHAPQRLHEHRRHAAAPADAADRSLSVDAADVPRQRLDVRVDGDRRRRDARLPAQGRSGEDVRADPHRSACRCCARRRPC